MTPRSLLMLAALTVTWLLSVPVAAAVIPPADQTAIAEEERREDGAGEASPDEAGDLDAVIPSSIPAFASSGAAHDGGYELVLTQRAAAAPDDPPNRR